jgi:hypothetical protein
MPSSQNHKTISAAICGIALIAMSSGCASRVILVPEGEPLLLAEPVKARVFVKTKDGNLVRSQNRVTIPAGWYALPKD